MAKVIRQIKENEELILKVIKSGGLVIYRTDTIYGIGCDATNTKSVAKLKALKGKKDPVSVLAPSKKWIRQNCVFSRKWLKKLPGAYTLILPFRGGCVARNVNNNGDLLGIRYVRNSFTKLLDVPFVTTSVNKSGEAPMTCLDDLDDEFFDKVDLIVYTGVKKGSPSTLVFLGKDKKVVRR